MTALEINADIYRSLGIISENENVLRRVSKYLTRVAKQMTNDPTCMTKDEYFRRLDEAEKGPSKAFASVTELDQYLRSL